MKGFFCRRVYYYLVVLSESKEPIEFRRFSFIEKPFLNPLKVHMQMILEFSKLTAL
jgi:hypothetical protein